MWTFMQLLGAFIVVAGVAAIYLPAAAILAGVIVFTVGLLGES